MVDFDSVLSQKNVFNKLSKCPTNIITWISKIKCKKNFITVTHDKDNPGKTKEFLFKNYNFYFC
jgi:hypothetical protein